MRATLRGPLHLVPAMSLIGGLLWIPLVTHPAEAALLVTSFDTNNVLEYDETTGTFQKVSQPAVV